jgi:predicted MFS family arabinose efflux permease
VLNPWRGLSNLPAIVWIIFATTLVNRAGTMVLPFLTLYVTHYLGQSAAAGGLALTAYGLGSFLTAPLAGRLADRMGAFRVMQASLLASGVLLVLIARTRSLAVVLGLVFVWSAVTEAVRPASLSVLTDATPADQRKAAFALNRLAINLGMSVGPAVGGFLATASFPMLFVVDGMTSAAAAIVLTFLLRRNPATSATLPAGADITGGVLSDRRMLAFMAAIALCACVFFQIDATLPLYLVDDLSLPVSFFGLLFTLNTVLIILIEVPLNLATAHWPHRRALVLGAMLFAVGFGALAFTNGPISVAATVVIWTFGEMILFPVAASYVSELAPPSRRGEYMGAYWMAFALAMMIGPLAGTMFMARYGARALWLAVLMVGLFAAWVAFIAVEEDHT